MTDPAHLTRAALRIAGLSTCGGVLLLAAGLYVLPMARGSEGVTACLPIVGAVTRLAPAPPDDRRAAAVHEAVHAAQCERFGAVRHFLRYQRARGRLVLEAEAFCADATWRAERGENPWVRFEFIIDALSTGYRGLGALPHAEVRDSVRAQCPGLAAAADSVRAQRRPGRDGA